MSPFTSSSVRPHDELLFSAPDAEVTILGQKHDRTQGSSTMSSPSQGRTGAGDMDISAGQKMMSATWGSVLTSVLVTPLDVVRVRLQSQPRLPSATNLKFPAHTTSFNNLPPNLGVTACCKEVFWVGDNGQYCLAGSNTLNASAATADCAVEETQRKTFTSTLDGLRKIARNEGALSLWRGLSPTLVMAIPANVIYFTGYDWLRHSHRSPIARFANDTYSPLAAGAVARVAAAICVSPIEMFRTRMQATSGSATGIFKSTLMGLHTMTQTQGYGSLWRGLTLTMWRDVPFSGIYWWGYEAVRNSLTDAREKARGAASPLDVDQCRRHSQSHEKHTTTFVDSFVAGAVSGAIAAFVTTPFDVGKTRQQVYKHSGDEALLTKAVPTGTSSVTKAIPPEQLSMPRFLYHIFEEEGARGLFKGWAARCLKVAPACAIMISSYEVGKKWARAMNERVEGEKETGGKGVI